MSIFRVWLIGKSKGVQFENPKLTDLDALTNQAERGMLKFIEDVENLSKYGEWR